MLYIIYFMYFTLDAEQGLYAKSHKNPHWRKRLQMQRMRHGKSVSVLIK